MSIVGRILFRDIKHFRGLRGSVGNDYRSFSSSFLGNPAYKEDVSEKRDKNLTDLRHVYPEFLPDPQPQYRNAIREKLERMDMIERRKSINIPEFYVGSILKVSFSDKHAPGKSNSFMGICISKKGCGLRSEFILRNVIDKQGVEVSFNLYDPTIQSIACLRLEKRLDDELFYLRDAPLEYSTFPPDMEQEYLPEGSAVPVNDLKVPLNPPPWLEKYERKDLKGVTGVVVTEKRRLRAEKHATPWERLDLMKTYRSTIPEEEQQSIFSEVAKDLHQLELTRQRMKRKRTFVRPKKSA